MNRVLTVNSEPASQLAATTTRLEGDSAWLTTIGINGFGRIGRTVFRIWLKEYSHLVALGAINTSGSMSIDKWRALLQYDTTQGRLGEPIDYEVTQAPEKTTPNQPLIGYLLVRDWRIPVTALRDPGSIPWWKYQVKTVIEATGVFTDSRQAKLHLLGDAKKVIISAPGKDSGVDTSVLGVKNFAPTSQIISNASCTTNCAAPIIKVLSEAFGIQKAFLNTVHAFTDDQNLQDNSHKDLRRARSAPGNIAPTTTGAAATVGEIFPAVKGKFNGLSVRVPVSTGSLCDIVFLSARPTSVQEVNQVLIDASNSEALRGIIATTTDPIVSSDIIGRSESGIVDLALTDVVDGDLVRVVAWYDNEYGYCCRLLEQAIRA